MPLPPKVLYATEAEYKTHYEQKYCKNAVTTFDGIRVHFAPDQFEHAFYESTARDGKKDAFSSVRAERIDWIKATLENPAAALFKGWNKKTHKYDSTRRVTVVYQDFVVVVAMGLKKQDGSLKAKFVTCYQADNSIGKIKQSPAWSKVDCLHMLGGAP